MRKTPRTGKNLPHKKLLIDQEDKKKPWISVKRKKSKKHVYAEQKKSRERATRPRGPRNAIKMVATYAAILKKLSINKHYNLSVKRRPGNTFLP